MNREPYSTDAEEIISLCVTGLIDGCVAAHTITNLFYILRKELSVLKRREILLKFCRAFSVISIDMQKLENALQNDVFKDFEDCLQVECAKDFGAEFIITRDVKDFKEGLIKTVEPRYFLQQWNEHFLKNYH